MANLFRKIRKQLADDNRPLRYMRYALGEIVLVVFGILIALQINNWNQERSNNQQFTRILREIQLDLISDMENMEPLLKAGIRLDSVAKKIVNGELTYEDYNNPENTHLFWIGLQFPSYIFQTTSFNKLKNYQGVIPEKYDETLDKINHYFLFEDGEYTVRYNYVQSEVKDRHDYLSLHYAWYALLREHEHSDEMIEYYLNDPIYKNWISQFKAENLIKPGGKMNSLKFEALKLFLEIDEKLENNSSNKAIISIFGEPKYDSISNYIGKYQSVDDSTLIITIENKGGYLFYNGELMLKEIRKDYFQNQVSPKKYIEFVRDANGKINRTIFIDDDKRSEAVKL